MNKRTWIILVVIGIMHIAIFASNRPEELIEEGRQLLERRTTMSTLMEKINIRIIEIRGALKELKKIEDKGELTELKVKEDTDGKKESQEESEEKDKEEK